MEEIKKMKDNKISNIDNINLPDDETKRQAIWFHSNRIF